jgi:type II secretory pathway pseudopilin PulG
MATDLVNVGNFRFVPEAEAARLRLQDEGIQAFLSNAELVNMTWFLGNATGWVKILVPGDQAAAARAALGVLREEQQARRLDHEAPADAAKCLVCGESLPLRESGCPACGWSYAAEDDAAGADPLLDQGDAPGRAAASAGSEPLDQRHAAESPVRSDLDEDAAEKAETDATNFRLLVGILVFGIVALWLLPKLREMFQRIM